MTKLRVYFMTEKEKNKPKTITIRGVDPEIYENFVKMANSLGMTVGELMNIAMRQLLTLATIAKDKSIEIGRTAGETASKIISSPKEFLREFIEGIKDFDTISGIEVLVVGKSDLEHAEKPIVFINMKKLVFDDDVDIELFNNKIKSIKFVDYVVLPRNLPKLLVAKKSMFVKKIMYADELKKSDNNE